MLGALLTLAGLAVLGLVSLGIWAEVRRRTVGAVLRGWGWHPGDLTRALGRAAQRHPNPSLAWFETLFWLALLIPLLDHVLDPDNGTAAWWAWALTIGPHEIGHVVCIPFGRFLMVAGGSFWQVGLWVGLGAYGLWVRRHVNVGLLSFMVAGHSFINMSVYIRDAQERDLPLLFGLGEDAHDWYNLLRWLGLLPYDDLIADMALTFGALLALVMIGYAVVGVWLLPRRRDAPRLRGGFFSTLGARIHNATQDDIEYDEDTSWLDDAFPLDMDERR